MNNIFDNEKQDILDSEDTEKNDSDITKDNKKIILDM